MPAIEWLLYLSQKVVTDTQKYKLASVSLWPKKLIFEKMSEVWFLRFTYAFKIQRLFYFLFSYVLVYTCQSLSPNSSPLPLPTPHLGSLGLFSMLCLYFCLANGFSEPAVQRRQGNLLNALWCPKWEGNKKKRGYTHTHTHTHTHSYIYIYGYIYIYPIHFAVHQKRTQHHKATIPQ